MSITIQQQYDDFLSRIVNKLSTIGFFEKSGRNPKNISGLEYLRFLQSKQQTREAYPLKSVLIQYTASPDESRLTYRHDSIGTVTLPDEEFHFGRRFYSYNLLWGTEEISLDIPSLLALPNVILATFVEILTKGEAFLFESNCYSHYVDERDACVGNNIWCKPEELNALLMTYEAGLQYSKDKVTVTIGDVSVQADSTPKAVAVALIKHKIPYDTIIVPKRLAFCNGTFYLEGNQIKHR